MATQSNLVWFQRPLQIDEKSAILGLVEVNFGQEWIQVIHHGHSDDSPTVRFMPIGSEKLLGVFNQVWHENLVRAIIHLQKKWEHGRSDNKFDFLLFDWLRYQVSHALLPLESALSAIYDCLLDGAKTHVPPDAWRSMDYTVHRTHALEHIKADIANDFSEDHLRNAATRLLMCITQREVMKKEH